MSKSYWGAVAAVIGLITVWGYSTWWHYHEQNAQKRDEAANNDTAAPQKPIQVSCRSELSRVLCEVNLPDTEGADEHTKADLKAQQDVAEWSFLTMLFSGGSLIATMVGVYLLKRTLDATFAAVKDTSIATTAMQKANEIANTQVRPWLALKAEVDSVKLVEGNLALSVLVKAVNIGKSPARDVIIAFEKQNALDNKRNSAERLLEKVHRRASISGCLLPNETSLSIGDRFQIPLTGEKHFYPRLDAIVAYKEIGGKEYFYTIKGFDVLMRCKDNMIPINPNMVDENIELFVRDTGLGWAI